MVIVSLKRVAKSAAQRLKLAYASNAGSRIARPHSINGADSKASNGQILSSLRQERDALRQKLQQARQQRDAFKGHREKHKDLVKDIAALTGPHDPLFNQVLRRIALITGDKRPTEFARHFDRAVLVVYLEKGHSLVESIELAIRDGIKRTQNLKNLLASLQMQADTIYAGIVGEIILADSDDLHKYILDLSKKLPDDIADRHVYPEVLRAAFKLCDSKALNERLAKLHLLDNLFDARSALKTYGVLCANGYMSEALSFLKRMRSNTSLAKLHIETFDTEIRWAERYGELVQQKSDINSRASQSDLPRIAVVDYKQPDRAKASTNVGDYTQTVAMMGNLARHSDVQWLGDEKLVGVMQKIAARVRPSRRLNDTGADRVVQLTLVDRDGSNYAPPEVNTWMLAFGWYMHPNFHDSIDFPFHENINPIFLSFHCNNPDILDDRYVEYLRHHGPIGCRDWTTVYMMQGKGIPAFFSGCLTTTIDNIFPEDIATRTKHAVAVVDASDKSNSQTSIIQAREHVRWNDAFINLDESIEMIGEYADKYAKVVTSRLHSYLPATAIGVEVDFKPRNPSDVRFEGLMGLDKETIDTIRAPMLEKIRSVFNWIADGKPRDEIYSQWRSMCDADVQRAAEYSANCKAITLSSDHVNDLISAAARVGSHTFSQDNHQVLEVAVSTDRNLLPYVPALIASAILNSSMSIRFTVLCRELVAEDFAWITSEVARKANQAPSIEYIQCDHIDYGDIKGMLSHITISTMDRLLLPALLPSVNRLIYLDIDMIVLGDLKELHDLDLKGKAVGARASLTKGYGQFHKHILRAAKRLPYEKAWDLRRRALSSHDMSHAAFNAGLLVLDLERMRSDEFCEEIIPYATEYGLNDQEALNIYAASNWESVPTGWNVFPRQEMISDPKLIHWAGTIKPWETGVVSHRAEWEYYNKL